MYFTTVVWKLLHAPIVICVMPNDWICFAIMIYFFESYSSLLFPHPLFLPKKRLPDAAYRCGVASEGFGGVAYRCGIISEGSGGVMHRYGGMEGLAGVMQGCVVTVYCVISAPLSL